MNYSKQIGTALAEEIVRLVNVHEASDATKPFHDVLNAAGYKLSGTHPNHNVYKHPTKPKVGVLYGKAIGLSAISSGHTFDTPAQLKAHLGESTVPKKEWKVIDMTSNRHVGTVHAADEKAAKRAMTKAGHDNRFHTVRLQEALHTEPMYPGHRDPATAPLRKTCTSCGGRIDKHSDNVQCPCDIRHHADMKKGGAPLPKKWLNEASLGDRLADRPDLASKERCYKCNGKIGDAEYTVKPEGVAAHRVCPKKK